MMVNMLQFSLMPLYGLLFKALLDPLVNSDNYPAHSVINSELHIKTLVLQE